MVKEGFATLTAFERLLSRVHPLMYSEGRPVKEGFAAGAALIGALPCVRYQMSPDTGPVNEDLPTLRTAIALLSSVSSLVTDE